MVNLGHPSLPSTDLGQLDEEEAITLASTRSENVDQFLDGIESNLIFYQIPANLACAYLKRHFTGHARDWYEVLGYALVQGWETDSDQLKQRRKKVFRLCEIRNPTTRAQLLQVISKFEERYLAWETQGSSINYNERDEIYLDARRKFPDDRRNRNWRNAEVLDRQNGRRDNYRNTCRNRPHRNQGFENRNHDNRNNQRFENRNWIHRDDHAFGSRGVRYQFRNRGPSDKPPVVSRPYRYDRVKQSIIDYHVEKMLREGTIIPTQSPYASPVVLCRKNNGLPPDNPEAYRFAVDYRKLNAITKYPRYLLPVIEI
ncbi:retrovirus-related Pol polyprotein from transposon 297 [Trichonephila clavipes]|nr:retrovirus-related Pol polyprotein from transposon 297 [Trichonephila clavipes]